jgi:hypothetical protein
MNISLIFLVFFPVLVIVFGFSVRPLPLRVDAVEPAERRAQRCLRISFLLITIPAAVIGLIWKWSSGVGILCGIGGCLFRKRRSEGYQPVVVHAILLFMVIVGLTSSMWAIRIND